MIYLLQFCGLSDPLQVFYLEQSSGPAVAGFRPFQLDELLGWAQGISQQRHWDAALIHRTVMQAWMERADLIRQWQLRLKEESSDRLVVAALGTSADWERRCEDLFRA